MKLARFHTPPDGSGASFGVVDGDEVVDLGHRMASFEAMLSELHDATPRPDDPRWPISTVTWQPPIGTHAKIVCVGFNYPSHAAESREAQSERPTLFTRFPDSFVGAGQAVVRPYDTDSLDWEGELAFVIGHPARRVTADRADRHIAGFTCMAENSVREWQLHTRQATAGKNWHASGSCGPWLVTPDELGDGPLRVTTRLNGTVVQDDSTDRLAFSFGELLAYISAFTPLRPGDVIATGTPQGIGHRQVPPRYLRPGDELEVDVAGVGVLRNPITDEARPLNPAEVHG